MAVLCANCSGKLIFNPASQKLECAACGSRFDPEDVKDINADAHSIAERRSSRAIRKYRHSVCTAATLQ